MTPDYTDPAISTRIAFLSTQTPDGEKERWSEISVWWLHTPPPEARGMRWFSMVVGKSNLPGETDRAQTCLRSSLEGSMGVIRASDVGEQVKSEARRWRRAHDDVLLDRLAAGLDAAGEMTTPGLADRMRVALAAYDAGAAECPTGRGLGLGRGACRKCGSEDRCMVATLAAAVLIAELRAVLQGEPTND